MNVRGATREKFSVSSGDECLELELLAASNDGRVAFRVWPCAGFLVELLFGAAQRFRQAGHRRGGGCEGGGGGGVNVFSAALLDVRALVSSLLKKDGCAEDEMKNEQDGCHRTGRGDGCQNSHSSGGGGGDGGSSTEVSTSLLALELGCGTGAVGIACVVLGIADAVLLTDRAQCLELVEATVQAYNSQEFRAYVGASRKLDFEAGLAGAAATPGPLSLATAAYDWRAPLHELFQREAPFWDQRQPNLLIACECIYDTSHLHNSPLVRVIVDFFSKKRGICGAHQTRRDEPAAAVIAFETRDADIEGAFFAQLEQAAAGLFAVRVVGEQACVPSEGNDGGDGGAPCYYRALVMYNWSDFGA